MNKLITTVIFMFMVVTSFEQDISGHEADSLMKSLTASKTDNDRIDILFKLAQYHMFKPGEYAVDLDSANTCIEKAAALNAIVKSADANGFLVLLKSLFAREKGQMKEGKAMAESAVAMLKNATNKYYLGKAYFALSDYYDYNNPNENAEKIRLVELARKAFQQSGNIERQAFTLTFLADLYQLNDEKPRAIEKLDSAVALYKAIKYEKLQSVYILYSNIYFSESSNRQALNYGLMALKSALNAGDSTMTLCQIYNMLGIISKRMREKERAIDFFQSALKIAQKNNDNNSVLLLMFNIVQHYSQLQKPDEALAFMQTLPKKILEPKSEESYVMAPLCYLMIYTDKRKYTVAQSYCDELLELVRVHKLSDNMLSNFYIGLIKFWLVSNQSSVAARYIGKVDSLTKRISNANLLNQNYFLHFRLDTAQGNYKSAVENLLKYQTLNDSLFNENSSRQIKQLEVEYETEKHKNEIAVLNQKNQLAQNNLGREKLVRNFTIGGIALLIIIIGLLYRQYMHKQQNNKVILQKNEQLQHFLTEKEWLVKEIHHRVKNNFHIVASLLEIQSSYLKNKEALSAIKESQDRIHSMSIIHQKLYQSETLSTIHMPEYIYELVEYLRESYGIRENIIFTLDIESMELNHAVAITLGLILNEAITNSIKYAFANTVEGKISISLAHISDSQILLSIIDNGRGLPADFKNNIGTSMGMELLQGLAGDIGGSFSIETKEGTHIKIIFNDVHNIHTGEIPFRS